MTNLTAGPFGYAQGRLFDSGSEALPPLRMTPVEKRDFHHGDRVSSRVVIPPFPKNRERMGHPQSFETND
jgi:hypothetical protein